MSLNLMYELLNRDNLQDLTIHELTFILIVIRDNCLNDNTHEVLDDIIKRLAESC